MDAPPAPRKTRSVKSTEKKDLERAAAAVATDHDAYENAVESSENAAADLLEEVLRICRPALPALSSMVPSCTSLRGVVLATSRHGIDLVWTEADELALLEKRDSEPWYEVVPAPSAIAEFGEDVVAVVADHLRELMEKQLSGGKNKVTRRIARRAEMLRSIRILVANLETRELAD